MEVKFIINVAQLNEPETTDLYVFGFIQNGNHVSNGKECIEAIIATLR